MDDLGPPIAYLALERGTPVYDVAGKRVGEVEEVLGDLQADIFEGIRVEAGLLHGRHLVAGADQIASIHERGVALAVNRGELTEAGG